MIRCGSKKGYEIDMCLNENDLCVLNLLTILGSIVIKGKGERERVLYDLVIRT